MRQQKDVAQGVQAIKEVQSTLTTQSQTAARSQARLLVLAHTKMLYERRMSAAKQEEIMLNNLEHHSQRAVQR